MGAEVLFEIMETANLNRSDRLMAARIRWSAIGCRARFDALGLCSACGALRGRLLVRSCRKAAALNIAGGDRQATAAAGGRGAALCPPSASASSNLHRPTPLNPGL